MDYRVMGRTELTAQPLEMCLRQRRRVSRRETSEGLVPEQIKTYRSFQLASLVCINFLMSRKKFLVQPPLRSIVPFKEASSQEQPRYLCFGVPAPLHTITAGNVSICLVAFLISCNLSWMQGREINPSCLLSLWSFVRSLFSPCVTVVFAYQKSKHYRATLKHHFSA